MQDPENIRAISDEFASGGNAVNTFGLSNMVWSFGQFIGAPLGSSSFYFVQQQCNMPAAHAAQIHSRARPLLLLSCHMRHLASANNAVSSA